MKHLIIQAIGLLALTDWARAWDYEGHRLINQLALASLPTNFPAFVKEPPAAERIAFLAGEPDRWRNTTELTLKHFNNPDHYFDFEDLAPCGLKAETLTPFRYEFAGQVAIAHATNSTKFPSIDPAKDTDRTKALIGYLPWTIVEYYGKLKSEFSYLKAFEEGGTPEEIRYARDNIIYIMGCMGHFVGDGSQPLHTTIHYNGWVGQPRGGYTTNRTFHAWIDGGFIARAGIDRELVMSKVRPARLLETNIFPKVVSYLRAQHAMVIQLYELEMDHKFDPQKPSTEGIEFMYGQFLKAGHMLGDLWYTAWHSAPPDNFLRGQLAKRKLPNQ
ncbi:MAG TPA: hypothetical protein VJ063_21880 [Verrucomicrobiae bacterium]|nr:hypothetical protein [Verrucomicrobiae bacterium]